ncbi:hypothetical protein [Streptomyces phaeoluteigriseus]|uniref:hypothetical protein n=1 Tax=Streptomyces phaeoluteigriseus TaxID=114686 RepID=UPI0026A8E880
MTDTGDPAVDGDGLDAAFAEIVRRTGASIGALYLLSPDEQVLCLDVLSGAPAELAEPWARVPVAAPAPVATRSARGAWSGWAARARWPAPIRAPRWRSPIRWPWPPHRSRVSAAGEPCC